MNYTNESEEIVFLRDANIANTYDGKTISGNSIAENGIPSFDLLISCIEERKTYDQNLCSYISGNVEVSVSRLCSDVSSMNISISNDLSYLSGQISGNLSSGTADSTYLSSVISSYISCANLSIHGLSDAISCNDNDISYLSHNISCEVERNRNHTAYFKEVYLSDNYYDKAGEKIVKQLYGLLLTNLSIDYDKDKKIKNGFIFKAKGDALSSYVTYEDTTLKDKNVVLHNNDFILVNKDLADMRNICLSDIEVIKDYDLSVKFLQKQIISNDNDISSLSSQISANTDDLSALSISLSSISSDITSDISTVSSDMSVLSVSLSGISCDITSDISTLSSNVDFLLSVDKETMNYKGTLAYLPNAKDKTGKDLGYALLSAFVNQNIGTNANGKLKFGDMFKLSAAQSCLYDAKVTPATSIYLGENDFFIINKDQMVSDLLVEDLDIFRNSETECIKLSTSLSTTTRLSVEELQRQIISNDNDISALSDHIDYLSSTLSNAVKVIEVGPSDAKTIEALIDENFPSVKWNVNDIVIKKRKLIEGTENSLYEHTTYVYDGTNWKAADGNYSTDNVYLTCDLSMDGEYTSIGNFKKVNGKVECKGKNMTWLLSNMFDTTIYPTKGTEPSYSITFDNKGNYEVGTSLTPKFTIKYTQGKYNYSWQTSPEVDDGTSLKQMTIANGTNSKDITAIGTYTLPNSIKVTSSTSYALTVSNAKYTDGNVPKDSKGNDYSAAQRTESSMANTTTTDKITGYYGYFYGYKTESTALDDPSKITSAQVRALQNSAKTSFGQLTTTGMKQIFCACLKTAKSLTITDNKTGAPAGDIIRNDDFKLKLADGSTDATYTLFYINAPSAASSTITWNITLA